MNIFSQRRAALAGILGALVLFAVLSAVHVPKLPSFGVALLVGFLIFARLSVLP